MAASKGLVMSKVDRTRLKIRHLAVELGPSLVESRAVSQGIADQCPDCFFKRRKSCARAYSHWERGSTAQTWGEFDGPLAEQQGSSGWRPPLEFQEPALPPGGGSARSIDELRSYEKECPHHGALFEAQWEKRRSRPKRKGPTIFRWLLSILLRGSFYR